MDSELFTSYFELGFVAFMSTVTVGIFFYLLIVFIVNNRIFEMLLRFFR